MEGKQVALKEFFARLDAADPYHDSSSEDEYWESSSDDNDYDDDDDNEDFAVEEGIKGKLRRATRLLAKKKYEEASDEFVQLKEHCIDKELSESVSGLVICQLREGQYDKAMIELESAFKDIPQQHVTAKLLHSLTLTYLFLQLPVRAAYVCVRGCTKFRGNSLLQNTLVHLETYYRPALCKLKACMETEKLPDFETGREFDSLIERCTGLPSLNEDEKVLMAGQLVQDHEYFVLNGGKLKAKADDVDVDVKHLEKNEEKEKADLFATMLKAYQAKQYVTAMEHVDAYLAKDRLKLDDQVVAAYVNARCLMGTETLDNLNQAWRVLTQNQEIMRLPATGYALAKTYKTLNDTKNALMVLHNVHLDKPTYGPFPDHYIQAVPELDLDVLKEEIKRLDVELKNPPVPNATCRYAKCKEVFDKTNLKSNNKKEVSYDKPKPDWSSHIYNDDVYYKGFYRISCTEKCVVEYHSWCWKHKKEAEGIGLDKDYLNYTCTTPDCGAPVAKISVYKEQQEQAAVNITDANLTAKKLAEMKKRKEEKPEEETVEVKKPKKEVKVKEVLVEPVVEVDPMIELKQRQQKFEKEMNQKLNDLRKEKADLQKRIEDNKVYCKRQAEELQRVKSDFSDEQKNSYQLLEAQARLEAQNQTLQSDLAKAKLQHCQHICGLVEVEAKKYAKMMSNLNEHVLPESVVLPQIFGQLMNRAEEAANLSRNRGRNLNPTLLEFPDVVLNDMVLKKLNQEFLKVSKVKVKVAEAASGASGATTKSSQSKPKPIGQKLTQVVAAVGEVFTDMDNEQIFKEIMAVKDKNGKSLKGLTINDVIVQIGNHRAAVASSKSGLADKSGIPECSICLLELHNPFKEQKTLEPCGHLFHTNCIRQWFTEKRDCPLCRKHVLLPEEYPALGK